jgi:hypothetical protein
MPTATQNKKDCDDSCIGPECAHLLCHDGESNGTALIQCEGCGLRFCMPHLTETDMQIFLCSKCCELEREREYERWQESLMEQ